MNEAKSLVNMAISAMFSVMIIAGVLVLVGLGYSMWSYFSRQDAANQQMKDYVNYVAYDNTTVRGQEVISLFQYAKQEGLFICLFSNTTQDAVDLSMDGVEPGNVVHIYVPDNCPWKTIYECRNDIPVTHVNSHAATALQTTVTHINAAQGDFNYARCTCCFNQLDSYDKLVKAFTNNYDPSWNHLGHPSEPGKYAAYKALLVYDSDTSTDVIGFVLIRQTASTTFD